VADWHRAHPVQSLILRTGLMKSPGTLQELERRHRNTVRFLEGSQRRLQELEQAWPQKEPVYQQQLQQEGGEIQQARRNLQVVKQNPEHFQQVWEREDQSFRQQRQRSRERDRDRDRGGWSR
jgi:hypothetical protein